MGSLKVAPEQHLVEDYDNAAFRLTLQYLLGKAEGMSLTVTKEEIEESNERLGKKLVRVDRGLEAITISLVDRPDDSELLEGVIYFLEEEVNNV